MAIFVAIFLAVAIPMQRVACLRGYFAFRDYSWLFSGVAIFSWLSVAIFGLCVAICGYLYVAIFWVSIFRGHFFVILKRIFSIQWEQQQLGMSMDAW